MAVYTKITTEDLAGLPLPVNLEKARLEPILSGIENTNYHLFTDDARYILTLFEARTNAADLPFFIALMRHLAAHGLPCPDVLTETPFTVKEKPAIITSFLEGSGTVTTDPQLCFQVGKMVAAMHLAADDFSAARNTSLPPSRWRGLIESVAAQADALHPGMTKILFDEISVFEAIDKKGLPQGAIHEDLFPDNVFFKDGRLTGVIDFYYACTGIFIYDMMLAVNAWCGGDFEKIAAFRKGYDSLRPLSPQEITLLPAFGKAAALRIIATRLYDWFQPADEGSVIKKDPMEHFRILEQYRQWDAMRA